MTPTESRNMPQTTVLVVEDDSGLAEMYRLGLELEGYRVVTASSGEAALQTLSHLQPDIICLDISLPGIDGFRVLEHLRSSGIHQQTPVLLLTNHSEPELRERGRQLGARGYLIKAETTPNALCQIIMSRAQPCPGAARTLAEPMAEVGNVQDNAAVG
jgi:CheY-like chemotaxis protein